MKQLLRSPSALLELFILSNIAFLAVDVYVAHSMNQFAHWAEWIPFVYSLAAPAVLLAAMLLSGLRPPPPETNGARSPTARLSRGLGFLVGAGGIVVGVSGVVWHLESQFFAEQTLRNLVYTAPFVAPLAYTGLGLLTILNRMVPDTSHEWGRWVVLLAWGGWIGNFVLSLADHAQNAFFYWAEWIPVVASALAVGALLVAVAEFRNRAYLRLCLGLMVLQAVVALVGWGLHLQAIATSPMDAMWDRVVYSAPIFAPLLFADLALLAVIGLATLHRDAPAFDRSLAASA